MEWLVCLRSPATSLKSSCDTVLMKYTVGVSIGLDEENVSVGLDELHVCVGIDEIYICVGLDELHICSKSTWTWSW